MHGEGQVKIKLSKVTVVFTLMGLVFALVQIGLSLSFAAADSLVTKENISGVARDLWFTCPFVIGEIGMDNDHVKSDWVLFFAMMTGLNVLLYFVVGLVCSFIARMVVRWLRPSAIQS